MTIVNTIFNQLLYNKEYFVKVWPFLDKEFFDGSSKAVFMVMKKLVDEYKTIPSKNSISVLLEESKLPQVIYNASVDFVNQLEDNPKPEDLNWLLDATESYIKNAALFNATSKAIEIQTNAKLPKEQRDNKLPDVGVIPELMKDALSISFDSDLGHDWLESYEDRWLQYQTKANKIPFSLNILNKITKGGAEVGTLNILLMPTNCFDGKEEIEVYMTPIVLELFNNIKSGVLFNKVTICFKDLYEFTQTNGTEGIFVETESGLVQLNDVVKKENKKTVKIDFKNHSRIVAETHRFRDNGTEVYAKDAKFVDHLFGGQEEIIGKTFLPEQTVYDIMIPAPHWYTDQYGIIHHNTGKSLGLCSLAADYLLSGKNVVYISMEMSEVVCAKRIDANLLDISLDDLDKIGEKDCTISYQEFKNKMQNIGKKSVGRLKIKQYPTGGANVNNFMSYMNELKIKDNFIPEVVIVDYLGICASSRIKSFTENSYTLVKAIAEELRGFAVEQKILMWTAAQTTRQTQDSSDIQMGDVAECLHGESIVQTISGDKFIKDIKVGELVSSHDGFRPVIQVSHPKKDKAVKITTKSGKVIICSDKHQFPTEHGRKSIQSGLKIGDKLSVY